MIKEMNGAPHKNCPVWEDWEHHKAQTKDIVSKVTDINTTMARILEHTTHLHKLDKLDNLDLLVKAVAGKNENDGKMAYMVAKILGFVIIGLVFIIAALLTGQKLQLFTLH